MVLFPPCGARAGSPTSCSSSRQVDNVESKCHREPVHLSLYLQKVKEARAMRFVSGEYYHCSHFKIIPRETPRASFERLQPSPMKHEKVTSLNDTSANNDSTPYPDILEILMTAYSSSSLLDNVSNHEPDHKCKDLFLWLGPSPSNLLFSRYADTQGLLQSS